MKYLIATSRIDVKYGDSTLTPTYFDGLSFRENKHYARRFDSRDDAQDVIDKSYSEKSRFVIVEDEPETAMRVYLVDATLHVEMSDIRVECDANSENLREDLAEVAVARINALLQLAASSCPQPDKIDSISCADVTNWTQV